MKVSHLRILPAAVASLAVMAGMSGAAAEAATASSGHAAHVTTEVPAHVKGHIKAPVTGTFRHGTARGHFDGRFMPKKFTVRHGVLEATGMLRGKLVRANGTKLGSIHRTVTLPVRTPKASTANATLRCSILNLHLGTLNLNLLGLVVHLNPVHLTITAVPGAGNLLGNLLCKITHLLNSGTGHLGQISALLNRVLSLL